MIEKDIPYADPMIEYTAQMYAVNTSVKLASSSQFLKMVQMLEYGQICITEVAVWAETFSVGDKQTKWVSPSKSVLWWRDLSRAAWNIPTSHVLDTASAISVSALMQKNKSRYYSYEDVEGIPRPVHSPTKLPRIELHRLEHAHRCRRGAMSKWTGSYRTES